MLAKEIELQGRAVEIFDLKEEAEKVSSILTELKDELENNKDLLALAAPQLGHNVRIMALKFEDKIEFILNPLIVHRSDLKINREKNIQCGDTEYLIPRFEKVEVIYMLSSGFPKQIEFTGLAAQLFQQMNDILEGLQLSDYGLPIDADFDELSEEDKESIVKTYLDSLQDLQVKLEEDVNNDDRLREQQNTINFLTSIALGKTKTATKQPNRETRRKQAKMAKKFRRSLN